MLDGSIIFYLLSIDKKHSVSMLQTQLTFFVCIYVCDTCMYMCVHVLVVEYGHVYHGTCVKIGEQPHVSVFTLYVV